MDKKGKDKHLAKPDALKKYRRRKPKPMVMEFDVDTPPENMDHQPRWQLDSFLVPIRRKA